MGSSNPIPKISRKIFDLTLPGIVTKEKKKREEKSAERRAATQSRLAAEAEATQKLQEQQEATETAQESVRKQKARARRRTIFAGQPLEQNIFRKTLGG